MAGPADGPPTAAGTEALAERGPGGPRAEQSGHNQVRTDGTDIRTPFSKFDTPFPCASPFLYLSIYLSIYLSSQLVIKRLVDCSLRTGRQLEDQSCTLHQFFILLEMIFKHGFRTGGGGIEI